MRSALAKLFVLALALGGCRATTSKRSTSTPVRRAASAAPMPNAAASQQPQLIGKPLSAGRQEQRDRQLATAVDADIWGKPRSIAGQGRSGGTYHSIRGLAKPEPKPATRMTLQQLHAPYGLETTLRAMIRSRDRAYRDCYRYSLGEDAASATAQLSFVVDSVHGVDDVTVSGVGSEFGECLKSVLRGSRLWKKRGVPAPVRMTLSFSILSIGGSGKGGAHRPRSRRVVLLAESGAVVALVRIDSVCLVRLCQGSQMSQSV